jgi:hypothetical protein
MFREFLVYRMMEVHGSYVTIASVSGV